MGAGAKRHAFPRLRGKVARSAGWGAAGEMTNVPYLVIVFARSTTKP